MSDEDLLAHFLAEWINEPDRGDVGQAVNRFRAQAFAAGVRAGAEMGIGIGEVILGVSEQWPAVPANPYEADR